ncbi:MAG: hypothetical protein WC365_07855 [Candidatus Babeliales bacterium]|jgi:hypothetical protein
MFTNYISSQKDFEEIDHSKGTVKIDGKTYHWNKDNDPEYQDDEVLDISYWTLHDEDGESTNMVLAYDKRDDVEDPQEWGDEYDADNPYVLAFN